MKCCTYSSVTVLGLVLRDAEAFYALAKGYRALARARVPLQKAIGFFFR